MDTVAMAVADREDLQVSAGAGAGYAAWIADYRARVGGVLGRCSSATSEMVAAFPELTRVGGWVLTGFGAELEHFWCVTADGEVVDPTATQFQDMGQGGVIDYRAFEPGDEVRVGRCMDCGADIYRRVSALDGGGRASFCDEACELAFIRWQEGEP